MAKAALYDSILPYRRRSAVPDDLQRQLERLGRGIAAQRIDRDALDAVMTGLNGLLPGSLVEAAHELRDYINLGRRSAPASGWRRSLRSLSNRLFASPHPDLAWLDLFDGDGYTREPALHALNTPPRSAFFLYALALRLNDWVPQVRAAAQSCAKRILPHTAPDIIASCAPYLFERRLSWRRWKDVVDILDEALFRPDVIDHLAAALMVSAEAATRSLRHAMRSPAIDRHLPGLLQDAVNPSVRVVALVSLAERKARWPTGYAWTWTDKTYGQGRYALSFDERPIDHDLPIGELITQGANDRSALVRRAAAQSLINSGVDFDGREALISRLLSDRSPAVRSRAEYLRRQPPYL